MSRTSLSTCARRGWRMEVGGWRVEGEGQRVKGEGAEGEGLGFELGSGFGAGLRLWEKSSESASAPGQGCDHG
eukprot:1586318-Prymnesium_polylepis.1